MKNDLSINEQLKTAWLTCHRTCNLIARCEEAVFARVGISPQQFGVLHAISECAEPVTISKIAKYTDRDHNTISMIVDRMEKSGMVTRLRDLNDRRLVRIMVTENGKTMFKRSMKEQLELIGRLAVCFKKDELEQAIRLLENMRKSAQSELSRTK